MASKRRNPPFGGLGGQRVEAFQSDFAFYRGLDFILGRRYQVDPDAESYYNMSPYCAMDD